MASLFFTLILKLSFLGLYLFGFSFPSLVILRKINALSLSWFIHFFLKFFFNIYLFYLFIWLFLALATACGIKFPDQGSNPGPLHWEHRVLAAGPPGKSWFIHFLTKLGIINWADTEISHLITEFTPKYFKLELVLAFNLFLVFIYFWLPWVFIAARGLSCPVVCGILVPRPEIEPMSPALEGGFFTTGLPEKSRFLFWNFILGNFKPTEKFQVQYNEGFPHSSVVKNPPANAGDVGSIPLRKNPWRRKQQLTPVFLPGNHR